MFNVFDIAASAMEAQDVRLNTIASNMANASSASSTADEAYKAKQVIFAAEMQTALDSRFRQAGVTVQKVVESTEPTRMAYEPDNPVANEEGYVFYSNVNTISEMANMMSANRSFQNGVALADTAKKMAEATLQMAQ